MPQYSASTRKQKEEHTAHNMTPAMLYTMTEGPDCAVPQELVDIIIDHLYDDSESLRQCSLVCKAWQPSSTLHLFSRFSWPPCNIYWINPTVITCCGCLQRTLTFDDCHDFLLSSYRVQRAINHLRITGLRGSSDLSGADTHELLSLTFLFALPELLPGLRMLEVWALCFRAGIIDPPPHISTNPRSLNKLVLAGTTMLWDERNIFSVLSAFSHIDTVILDCHCKGEPHKDLSLASQVHRRFHSTSVRCIEVSSSPFLSHVLLHLCEQLDASALRELKVQYFLEEGLEKLVVSALSLEALTFMPSDTRTPLSLPNPTALRVLDMTCSVVAESPEAPPNAPQFGKFGWDEMVRTLRTFHASELRELTLGVMLRELGSWAADAAISQEVFAKALVRRLQNEDWRAFRAVMQAHPKLQKLRLKLIVSDTWSLFGCMAPYLACSARAFQDAVVGCLGRDVENILEVVAVHWHHMGRVTHHYRYR